ncbi:hypothetical protein ABPG75_010438 [Micractinium tetrahymenae]
MLQAAGLADFRRKLPGLQEFVEQGSGSAEALLAAARAMGEDVVQRAQHAQQQRAQRAQRRQRMKQLLAAEGLLDFQDTPAAATGSTAEMAASRRRWRRHGRRSRLCRQTGSGGSPLTGCWRRRALWTMPFC